MHNGDVVQVGTYASWSSSVSICRLSRSSDFKNFLIGVTVKAIWPMPNPEVKYNTINTKFSVYFIQQEICSS